MGQEDAYNISKDLPPSVHSHKEEPSITESKVEDIFDIFSSNKVFTIIIEEREIQIKPITARDLIFAAALISSEDDLQSSIIKEKCALVSRCVVNYQLSYERVLDLSFRGFVRPVYKEIVNISGLKKAKKTQTS